MHRPSAWRLSTRLVVLVVALAALGLFTAGVISVAALRGYLVGEVDRRLTEAAVGIAANTSTSAPRPAPRPGGGPVPGRDDPDRFLVKRFDALGNAIPSQVQEPADPPVLPGLTQPEAAELAGQPYEVPSESGDLTWRVVSLATADGSVSVAADVTGIGSTVNRLAGIELVTGSVVLVLIGLAAGAAVRRSLAPLVAVEHTAAAIAAGDLSRRAAGADPRTEIGSLSGSFNTMVDNVEAAFVAQRASEAAANEAAESERRSAQAARTSEERMRRFVADASHELRTPLTSVRGFAELYRMDVPPGARLDDVMGRIEAEARRMGLLVDDLLLLARLDQQRPLDRAPVDLGALVADSVAGARAWAPERGIRVIGMPAVVVVGDDARLRQVLDNLIGNALRYSPPEAPIEVRVGRGDAGDAAGERVIVEVVDHGPGMAPEVAERVFERFYRADPARSRAAGGSGLGLAIVAAIVAAHGGRVEVDTAPGAGTTMRVVLPV